MSIETRQEQMPEASPNGHNSVDVNMNDTVGAVFLGVLSLILLIGWVRAEARYRALIGQPQPAGKDLRNS